MNIKPLILLAAFVAGPAAAGETLNAAIGGGAGGAVGAAIGNEVGGRQGAIVGSAIGAAVGTAVATDEPKRPAKVYAPPPEAAPAHVYHRHPVSGGHPHYYHCPPGQAKKGRC
jgi:hypothetical protein